MYMHTLFSWAWEYYGSGSVVVDSLLIVTLLVGFCNCYIVLSKMHSNGAILFFL